MDGEDKLELFIMTIIGILYFNIIVRVDIVYYAIPIIVATALLLVFYILPKIKKIYKKCKLQNKSKIAEGRICDVITTYEKDHFVDSLTIVSNEYPVVEFKNDKDDWKKIIITIPEGEDNEFYIDDEVIVWYRYGRKERVQFLEEDRIFLDKKYEDFKFIDEKIEKFNEDVMFGDLVFYHENTSINYSEYKNTLIIREEVMLKNIKDT